MDGVVKLARQVRVDHSFTTLDNDVSLVFISMFWKLVNRNASTSLLENYPSMGIHLPLYP